MSVNIIAEVGPNHNGDLSIAKEMVCQLADIGVNAVKFQLGAAREALSLDGFKATYQKINDNADDIFEASKKRQLTHEGHMALAELCCQQGVEYLCTAFDLGSLVFLNEVINVARFKIASGEIFTLDMLDYVRACSKPIIMSTGMATYEEIGVAYDLLDPSREHDVTLLHCVSNYPARPEDINLFCMPELKRRFSCPVGYSDHTLGIEVSLAAVAMGATVIEKHVTLDRKMPGPDHKASATLEEFTDLVAGIRKVERCLGSSDKYFSESEREIARVARKSIIALHALHPGHVIERQDICFRRPGTGFLPTQLHEVIGRRVARYVGTNRVILPEHLA